MNLLVPEGRMPDALRIAHTAGKLQPKNAQTKDLIAQLESIKASQSK